MSLRRFSPAVSSPLAAAVVLVVLAGAGLAAQETRDLEWTTYGGDLASTRYSPADQITADNFADLEIAWRFKTQNLGPNPEFNFQSTPLMVGGVLYSTAGSRRAVVAVDAATGRAVVDAPLRRGRARRRGAATPLRTRPRLSGRRGQGGQILYVTPGYHLISLDAATGQRTAGLRDRRRHRPQGEHGPGHRPGHRRGRPARRPRRGGRHHRDRGRPPPGQLGPRRWPT